MDITSSDVNQQQVDGRHNGWSFDCSFSHELPLNEKDEGNTLETRGLTYSYTFLTKP